MAGPAPIPVELLPYSADWVALAEAEAARLKAALGPELIAVHHIGSTAIPGIMAKPIVDLMPEVTNLEALDSMEDRIIALGYVWWGEFGIPGRRYCTLSDPATGKRLVQLHFFATGSPHLDRHLAFRDYLRRNDDRARAYEAEKRRARDLHPHDSHAYSEAKSDWIRTVEAETLAEWRRDHNA